MQGPLCGIEPYRLVRTIAESSESTHIDSLLGSTLMAMEAYRDVLLEAICVGHAARGLGGYFSNGTQVESWRM